MKELYELLTPYSLELTKLKYELNNELKTKLKNMSFINDDFDHDCLKTAYIYKIKENIYALTVEITNKYYMDIFIDIASNEIYYSELTHSTNESNHIRYAINLDLYFNDTSDNYRLFEKEFKPIIDSIRLIS